MAIQRLVVAASLAGTVRLAAGTDGFTTVPQRDDRHGSIDVPVTAVSATGGHVAFASYARLVPADTDTTCDIYVFDRASGRVTLESGAADGASTSGDSTHPGITADGRLLVYQTAVAGQASHGSAVVLRDRDLGTATIIGTGPPSAWSGTPVISADGHVVGFVSGATHLVTGTDANGPADDVYVLEVGTGTIERVSVDALGRQPAAGASFAPSISGDGRRIAFMSTAPLDGPHVARAGAPLLDRPRVAQVYLRDRVAATTRLVSAAPGAAADGMAWKPAIDAGGRHVAFVSTATTLTREDRDGGADVFVADLVTGAIALISRSARGGGGNGPSAGPKLSADGRLVAFQSEASDLLCAGRCARAEEDINLLPDVFLFDRRAAAMTRVSGDTSGGWLEASAGPAIDGSGAVVAFSSRHPIDAADTKHDFDLFIRAAPQSPGHVRRVRVPGITIRERSR